MRYSLLIFIIIINIACNSDSNTSSVSTTVSTDGFKQIEYDNGIVFYEKYDSKSILLESKSAYNGIINGVWTINWPENGRIKTMTTYINGKKNGLFLSYNNRGQMESKSFYANNILNGPASTYKFGRLESLYNYKNGVFHGDFKEYFKSGKNAGAIEKLVQYKEGKQHGKLLYYNEQGDILMEYSYKNGEKISGGITKK